MRPKASATLCSTVARHASTRSYRRGIPSMARQDETTCVQRWSSRSERVRGWEKHNNNRMPCRQALSRAVGLGTKLFGLDRAHCGCIAHIADLDGEARRFHFPSFPADLRGAFSIFTHRSFVALRLDERERLLSFVVVYFSLMRWCEMSRFWQLVGSACDRGSQTTIADHVRQTYSMNDTTTIHNKEIPVTASACSSSIRHAVLIVALGVTATAYRQLSLLRGSTALLLLSIPIVHSRYRRYHDSRSVQRCLMYSQHPSRVSVAQTSKPAQMN